MNMSLSMITLDCAGVVAATADPGSVQHEIGGGIHGTVNGHSIALGSLEWISKHAELPKSDRSVQPEARASPTHSQTEVRISQLRHSLPHSAEMLIACR